MIKLTERLQLIADEVNIGETVADIGTDHGYLPLYLYENGISPHVIMSDISQGSLEKCRADCEIYHPDHEFDLRLGSGLDVLQDGEVDTVVMAGMGGMLMIDLLNVNLDKSLTFRKFILQPRKHMGRLRYFLKGNGFHITNEVLAKEGKFIWPIITAESGERAFDRKSDPDDIEFEYPLSLLEFRNAHTEEYVLTKLRIEREKLESKSKGSLTTSEELRNQQYRVSYMEYLAKRL